MKLYAYIIVHTRRWYGSSSLRSLLLRTRLDLIDYGLRIHTPAIKVALICQQVLGIVLAQCVSRTTAGTDAQEACYILPRLVFCYLQKKVTHTRSLLRLRKSNFTLNLKHRQKRSAWPKETDERNEYKRHRRRSIA